ncbi:MAG: hydroxymethylpyrimidine/phosphomethylpyrimidine kinase [Candidatus Pelagadaptatus aseana]|uniref:bifunctional hydroxymethylpyrimidine kinase/phosphomethylpyrimidine kinase n=1 Tax=Candidatus Pelagadaptatus aseana TaxID=3120508 RepID=UPI0039B22D21
MNFADKAPVILSLSLHDPSGGSGIQADIETANSLGCHCTSVITLLCSQDTRELKSAVPVNTPMLIEQVRAILEDMPIAAIKIGCPGSTENIEAIHSILRDYPDIPVVLDPGTRLLEDIQADNSDTMAAIRALLLPQVTLLSANIHEAYDLAQQADTLDACAQELLETGCGYVLINGSKRSQKHYDSVLYDANGIVRSYSREWLNILSRGHGTTLSASLTCYLAHGLSVTDAAEQAQSFTWKALANHHRPGMGKQFLNRFFWADKNKKSAQ